MGFEPTRCRHRQILSLVRLPIPPLLHRLRSCLAGMLHVEPAPTKSVYNRARLLMGRVFLWASCTLFSKPPYALYHLQNSVARDLKPIWIHTYYHLPGHIAYFHNVVICRLIILVSSLIEFLGWSVCVVSLFITDIRVIK